MATTAPTRHPAPPGWPDGDAVIDRGEWADRPAAAGEDPAEGTRAGSDRNGVQVISRAAAILRSLENEPAGLSLGELATRLGLARSTVQRIVRALTDERLLMPAGPSGRVTFGPLLARLGGGAAVDVVQSIRPVVERLSRTLRETVDVSVLHGQSVLFVDQVEGPHRLAAVSKVGEAFPLHCTANGKALLAAAGADQLARLLPVRLARETGNTIVDPRRLREEIEVIARTGIAHDREEHAQGISAVGTWFLDRQGRPYALSVPVPTLRFKSEAVFGAALLAARREIEHLLAADGVRPPRW